MFATTVISFSGAAVNTLRLLATKNNDMVSIALVFILLYSNKCVLCMFLIFVMVLLLCDVRVHTILSSLSASGDWNLSN